MNAWRIRAGRGNCMTNSAAVAEKPTVRIPLSVPVLTGREQEYVQSCLTDGWVSSVGPFVTRFEKECAEYVGTRYAVATVNGTAALHLALLACGVQSGDAVLVPTFTFIATANAVRYCGATPIFFDCDADSLCMDSDGVRAFFETRCVRQSDGACIDRATGHRIAAVLPVHIFGHPADMWPLLAVASSYGVPVIEDAAGAIGSTYEGRKVGSLGRSGCYSFNGNKIITTGGGGMVVTDDERISTTVRHLSTQAKVPGNAYAHDAVGYNYRLTNVQAAIGVAQLERLDAKIARKRVIAARYAASFAESDAVQFVREQPNVRSNAWYQTIRVDSTRVASLIDTLEADGIQARPAYIPIHTFSMYRECPTFAIARAPSVAASCVNIPCTSDLTDEHVDWVAAHILASLHT